MVMDANWYPDPARRHQYRYWDGATWTEHVSDEGVTSTDSVDGLDRLDAAVTLDAADDPDAIKRQVSGGGYAGAGLGEVAPGGGTLFTEPVLVVNQKAKLFELAAQYGVFDAEGKQLGSVNEVGQSFLRKMVRLFSELDQFLTHRFEIRDVAGSVVMRLTRPGKIFKSKILVGDSSGAEIGKISQENMIGKIHFGMWMGDQKVGSIRAENWRAWNFRIEDASGQEVARITKTFEGVLKTMFTTADNYVVQIHPNLDERIRPLVVAAAVSVDTALKQDSRGLS